jgi:hypothetical protein
MIYGIYVIPVILSGIVSLALGFAWYSPILFEKPWMAENGFRREDLNPNPLIYIFAFILSMFIAVGINLFLNLTGWSGILPSLGIAAIFSLVFVIPTMGTHFLFEKKSIKLYLIDTGYQVVFFLISGLIIGLFVK